MHAQPELLPCNAAEEIAGDTEARRQLTRQMWTGRLKGVRRNVEVWQALLCVRGLVLAPEHDHTTTLKFASLCLKSGRKRCVAALVGHSYVKVHHQAGSCKYANCQQIPCLVT